jgi:hypothetical protein
MHQDPRGTSAWNTSLTGRKRWVMAAPVEGVTKNIMRGRKITQREDDVDTSEYFYSVLPLLKQIEGPGGSGRIKFIEGI